MLKSKNSFGKAEIYEALKNEKKAFVGRVIGEVARDGLLTKIRKITGITIEAPLKATKTIREIVQTIADNEDPAYNIRVLSKRLHHISKNITQDGKGRGCHSMKKTTRAWVDFANRDLEAAGLLANNEYVSNALLFHSQQCVEKGLK